MDRSRKHELVAELHETFKNAELLVVTHQVGMSVPEVSNLRAKMRAAGAGYKVTKNRLARIALKGTKFEHLDAHFTGPSAVAYSSDPIAAAKVAVEFQKGNDKFKVIAGGLAEKSLDADAVKALATLPSLDELRGKLVGLLQAPASKLARVTQAPAGQLARVFAAYAEKGQG